MTKVRIPPIAIPGFNVLSNLDEHQIKGICDYLEKMPVGTKMQSIDESLLSVLNPTESQQVVQTLRSFSELLEPSDVDFDSLSTNLASSFKGQAEEDISDEQVAKLKNNLFTIFTYSKSLKLTLKALDLLGEDNNLVTDSKIITDIRLVFNDNIEEENRNAILIHRLHIEYFQSRRERIVFALDSSDLLKLKGNIERAIIKEDAIKKDYEKHFHFLNLSDDE